MGNNLPACLPACPLASVQTLETPSPSRANQASITTQVSRAGRFVKTTENRQLQSQLHINVLWLATRIKHAQFAETVFFYQRFCDENLGRGASKKLYVLETSFKLLCR
jgi:hypothetical protein